MHKPMSIHMPIPMALHMPMPQKPQSRNNKSIFAIFLFNVGLFLVIYMTIIITIIMHMVIHMTMVLMLMALHMPIPMGLHMPTSMVLHIPMLLMPQPMVQRMSMVSKLKIQSSRNQVSVAIKRP